MTNFMKYKIGILSELFINNEWKKGILLRTDFLWRLKVLRNFQIIKVAKSVLAF